MSARQMKKIRREANKTRRQNVIQINRALQAARKAQIRRTLIGVLLLAAFGFAISRVFG